MYDGHYSLFRVRKLVIGINLCKREKERERERDGGGGMGEERSEERKTMRKESYGSYRGWRCTKNAQNTQTGGLQ